MRKLFPLLALVVFGAGTLFAQQANISAPVTPPTPHHYRVESAYGTRDAGGRWEMVVSIRDSGDVELSRQTFNGPDAAHPGATALAYVTAQMTAVGGETGGNARRMDARYLTFLQVNGYISATVVP